MKRKPQEVFNEFCKQAGLNPDELENMGSFHRIMYEWSSHDFTMRLYIEVDNDEVTHDLWLYSSGRTGETRFTTLDEGEELDANLAQHMRLMPENREIRRSRFWKK